MFLRSDMMVVTLDGEFVPWESAEGGAAVAAPIRRIEDLVLRRPRKDDSASSIVRLTHRVGLSARVTLAHLDPNGKATGNGLVYEGTIASVLPGAYDANSNKPCYDRLVLSPTSIRPLWHT